MVNLPLSIAPLFTFVCRQLLLELGQQPALERFRLEYETLYRALKKSHDSEKRLIKKCRELTQDIGNTQQKTTSAIKLSQNDQTDIANLKSDILRMCALPPPLRRYRIVRVLCRCCSRP